MNLVLVVLAVIAITVEVHGNANQRKKWFGLKMDAVGARVGRLSPSIRSRILDNANLNTLFKDDSDAHGVESDALLDKRLDDAESNHREEGKEGKRHLAMLKIKDELRKYTNDHENVINGYSDTARCLRKYNDHEGSWRDTNTRLGKNYNCGDSIYRPDKTDEVIVAPTPCGGSASQVRYRRLDYFNDMGITATLILNWMNNLPNKPGRAEPSNTASTSTSIGQSLYGADKKRPRYKLSCHFVLTGIKNQ